MIFKNHWLKYWKYEIIYLLFVAYIKEFTRKSNLVHNEQFSDDSEDSQKNEQPPANPPNLNMKVSIPALGSSSSSDLLSSASDLQTSEAQSSAEENGSELQSSGIQSSVEDMTSEMIFEEIDASTERYWMIVMC